MVARQALPKREKSSLLAYMDMQSEQHQPETKPPALDPRVEAFVKKNRVYLELLGLAALLLFVLWAIGGFKSAPESEELANDIPVEVAIEETEEIEEEKVEPAPTYRAPANTGITYEEMIAQYAGKRFQFIGCRGTPGTMTMTTGNYFAIDNRDERGHTIAIGGHNYWLGPHGWKVVRAPSVGTHNITCDGGGAAQIRVQ